MARTWRTLGLFLTLGLGLGLIILLGVRTAAEPLGQIARDGGSHDVGNSTNAGQTFLVPFDGLYRVDVFLGPDGRTKQGEVLLRIRPGPDTAEDLRFVVVSAATVVSNDWVSFEFDPIADSGGKRYYLLVEFATTNAEDKLSVFHSAEDRYRDGVYYQDGVRAEGDLAFLIYSQPGPVSWLRGLGQLLAQGKPMFAGEPLFYGLLAAVYLILLAVAVSWLQRDDDAPVS